jgi:hypothetical protein
MKNYGTIHPDLLAAQKLAYEPSGLAYTRLMHEAESQEYGACVFEMNKQRIAFRTGKITPTKIGQFVTLWKRIGNGPIVPYDLADPIDLFVISIHNTAHFGQFVFPKALLFDKGFVSKERMGGKRAMRVYPPWDKTNSQQAQKTQAWQLIYFFEIYPNRGADTAKIKELFSY